MNNVLIFTDNDGNIWSVKPDGSALTQIVDTSGGKVTWVIARPDAAKFLAWQGSSTSVGDVVLMNPDGSGVVAITNLVTASSSLGTLVPSFSPDGTRFATSYDSGIAGDVGFQIVNVDNSGHTTVPLAAEMAHGTVASQRFLWSPDGTKIAFTGNTVGVHHDTVYVCNTDGSGLTAVLTGDGTLFYDVFAWYADSTNLLVTRTNNGTGDLQVWKTDGGTTTTLYDDPTQAWFGLGAMVLSPDGTEVVFASTQTGSVLGLLSGGVPSALVSAPPPPFDISFWSVDWTSSPTPPPLTPGAMSAGTPQQGLVRFGRY